VSSTVNDKENNQKRNDRNDEELSAIQTCPVDAGAMPGLDAPAMDLREEVTGANNKQHRIDNKRRRVEKQAKQQPHDYWSNHRGQFSIPTPKQAPKQHRGGMCPSGLALHHPAVDLLLQYSMEGCPTKQASLG